MLSDIFNLSPKICILWSNYLPLFCICNLNHISTRLINKESTNPNIGNTLMKMLLIWLPKFLDWLLIFLDILIKIV
jgi:hypothetical protein